MLDIYRQDNVIGRLLLCSCLVALSLNAMPLSPESVNNLRSTGELEDVVALKESAYQQGIDAPSENILDELRHVRRDDPRITLHVPVILVDFEDNQANFQVYPTQHYRDLLFGIDAVETGSMREWYLENSYGEVDVIGEVVGWYRAPQTYDYYVNGQNGFGNYPRNSQRMVRDLVQMADNDIDYSRYDNDRNGVLDVVFLVHAGPGAEEHNGDRDMIWSHSWSLNDYQIRLDNTWIRRFVVTPDNGQIGVYGHELGHALFGLPDLYDRTYESAGLGAWSMMSFGSWNDGGRSPAHFDIWSKIRAGILTPTVIEQDQRAYDLPPIINEPLALKLWTEGNAGEQYFLVENRQQMGFDRALPAGGVLIYHVDEDVIESQNDRAWRPEAQDNGHYLVALEQSDGLWDLERNRNRGDDGDPFPGRTGNRNFTAESRPNSKDYGDNDTRVTVRNIRYNDEIATFDVEVGIPIEEREVTLRLYHGWNTVSINILPGEEYWDNENGPNVVLLTEQLRINQQQHRIELLKDGEGRFYHPGIGFNNIPYWNVTRGYQIKVIEDCELVLVGEPLLPSTEIQLQQGWNLIGYPPNYQLDASAPEFYVLSPIINDVETAKDALGRFIRPEFNFSNMPPWRPSEGYHVKVRRELIFTYPVSE